MRQQQRLCFASFIHVTSFFLDQILFVFCVCCNFLIYFDRTIRSFILFSYMFKIACFYSNNIFLHILSHVVKSHEPVKQVGSASSD